MKKAVKFVLMSLLPGVFSLAVEPVRVDFFYEPGCRRCEGIEEQVLPELESRFGTECEIRAHDIGVETNFLYLLQLEEAAGYAAADRAYLVVGGRHAFGAEAGTDEVAGRVEALLTKSAADPAAAAVPPQTVARRYGGFTFPAVLAAGVIDGINPCAISTLVFFMSLLSAAKVRGRRLLLLGIAFCVASFLTYLAIGFGLFRALHLFSGFTALRRAGEAVMAVLLLGLAAFSFRDAVRFARSGKAADVSLQLSAGMKGRIHGVMRRGLGSGWIFFGGLFIGAAVTVLESVCTGQVYVPALVLILKESAFSESRAWWMLLAYNLMFVLPLVAVFAAVYSGLKTEALLRWSRRNVVPSKLLAGVFFILMALFLAAVR